MNAIAETAAPSLHTAASRLPVCVARMFERRTVMFAWAVLALAIVHPPHETGLQLCLFHASTGVPCPGCGLVRSLACAARALFERSWTYHPVGIPLLLLFAGIAIVGVLPAGWRDALQHAMLRRATLVRAITIVLFTGFAVFGMLRAIDVIVNLALERNLAVCDLHAADSTRLLTVDDHGH